MSEDNNVTNSTLTVTSKSGSKVDSKLLGPVIAAIGLALIIVTIVVVQAVRGFRNRRRRVYNVSDKVLKNGITGENQVIETETAIQNDINEDEPVHMLHYEHSTEQLITTDELDHTTLTSQPRNTIVTELPDASEPLTVTGGGESSKWNGPLYDEVVSKREVSEEHFIPRANPLLLHLKKKNKIAPLAENTSLTSSITSGSTTEITDEELIIIGTAIKSCPHFGRESSDTSTRHDQDEPCETISYPILTQNDETTKAKTSASFQLQEISSASEISSAEGNFYQFSADNMDDMTCSEVIALNRKDLWSSQDVVSEDVIIIDN